MAEAPKIPDEAETRARWGAFAWTPFGGAGCMLAAAVSLCACSSAIAQSAVAPAGGDGDVKALIADLSAGRRDAAIKRISQIESLSGKRLVTTPAAFVDRLLGCTASEAAKMPYGDMVRVMWTCPTGKYVSVFDAHYARPYILVGEFQDAAVMEQYAKHPVIFAPPPIPPSANASTPEERAAAKAEKHAADMALIENFAASVVSGTFAAKADAVMSGARITLGRRNVLAKVTIVELDGTGPDALIAQTRAAVERVGKPNGYDCQGDEYLLSCRFKYDATGKVLLAMFGTKQGQISWLSYTYATTESAIKDAAEAPHG